MKQHRLAATVEYERVKNHKYTTLRSQMFNLILPQLVHVTICCTFIPLSQNHIIKQVEK